MEPETKPNTARIRDAMSEIAFSTEEKTSDRLRALDLLTELIREDDSREEAMAKLDALLALLGA